MVEPGALDVLKAVGGSCLFYLKAWRQRNFADLRADPQLREIIDLYFKWHFPEEYWTGMDHIKTISAKVFNDDKAARLSVNEVRKKAKWFQMHFLGALPNEFLMELQAVDRRPRTGSSADVVIKLTEVENGRAKQFLEWRKRIVDMHVFLNELEHDLPDIEQYTHFRWDKPADP
ncbi:uncharacterized protein PGTG_17739 [Puccinia graminis f. sp. tritici CRL 75-36-700-3]|uniref:Uncharacterized protein n=1 Tax=Puccinia graminis f. sp. tritici (strain CRL 75-36-700-3 / race SCCL) TaxID=418459 RepID=E3L4L4_PUCGT|nr:uncharacterized protein PGTG_17739 [Puccinia graminis f. sp. tritici CRL 75-36-700-3]EFP91489.1 hypothetical protein PGTG_17739 [Puccinia graminis f. sp. tritici CRL 75-36-700-3]